MWRAVACAALAALGTVGVGAKTAAAPKPHILMVIVDDFGWADAGWHREVPTREVLTPTMDALVKEGVELNRHCEYKSSVPSLPSLSVSASANTVIVFLCAIFV